MIEPATIIVPTLSAIFAFFGAIIGNKVDISWIKKELSRHDGELLRLQSSVNKAFHIARKK